MRKQTSQDLPLADQNRSQSNNQYKNTFYEPGYVRQNGSNVLEAQNLILSSKKLIQQIEDKKYKGFLKSNKKINLDKEQGKSKKIISIKEKIQGSRRNIIENKTIADELLFENKAVGEAAQIDMKNKNKEYLNVIQNVYSHKNKKRRSRRKNEHSSSSEETKKKKKSHKELQMMLNQEIARNVRVKGSHHFISPSEAEQKFDNTVQKKVLLQQVERYEQKQKQNKSRNNQAQVKREKKFYNQYDSQRDRVSIKFSSKQQIQNEKQLKKTTNNKNMMDEQQLIDLSLSSSQQDKGQQYVGHQDNQYFIKLAQQIDKDIKSIKAVQSKPKIKSNFALEEQKKVLKQQEQQNIQQDKSKQTGLNKKATEEKGKNLFSFREDQYASDNQLMDVPMELIGKISSQHDSKIPYHTDYGINISQSKIQQILNSVKNRIKYSAAVIDVVVYDHQRQDNNQLQIDNRYCKQTKDRRQMAKRITNYAENKNELLKKGGRLYKYDNNIKFDQFGKKMLRSTQIWRIPGKSITNKSSFVGLNSPILNGQSCCGTQKAKYFNSNWKYLLECRSADTLASVSSAIQKKNRLRKKIKNCQQVTSSSESEYQDTQLCASQSKQQKDKCIMKQNSWEAVRQVRKAIQN